MSRAQGRASVRAAGWGDPPREGRTEGRVVSAAGCQPRAWGGGPGMETAKPGVREQVRGAWQDLRRGSHPRPGVSACESSASHRAAGRCSGSTRRTRHGLSPPAFALAFFVDRLPSVLPVGRTLTRQGHAVTTQLSASVCSADGWCPGSLLTERVTRGRTVWGRSVASQGPLGLDS